MPKIAAAVAVCLTAITCVGFNTARYPVVWEMAGGAGRPAQAAALDCSAAAGQAAIFPQSEPAAAEPVPARAAPPAQPGAKGASHPSDLAPLPQFSGAEPKPLATKSAKQSAAGGSERAERVARRAGADRGAPKPSPSAAGCADPTAPQHAAALGDSPRKPSDADQARPDAALARQGGGSPAAGGSAATTAKEAVEAPACAKAESDPPALAKGKESVAGLAAGELPEATAPAAAFAAQPGAPGKLVPVKPAQAVCAAGDRGDGPPQGAAFGAEPSVSRRGSNVKRLPPVDQVAELPVAGVASCDANAPICIYPTAGAR